MTTNEIKQYLLSEDKHDFKSLLLLVELLRSPDGCPWDKEQTHKTIRNDLIEETYEVVEAIDTDDNKLLCEELGDLLFQIIFHCDMEKDIFSVDDVIDGICSKMIYRHPHVFADGDADTSQKVLDAWDKLKKEEKSRDTVVDEMNAVPAMLPALMRTQKVVNKAIKAGYQYVYNDDNREACELVNEIFADAVKLKKLGVNAEEALAKKTDEFIKNYNEVKE